jgi:hypothetical protein
LRDHLRLAVAIHVLLAYCVFLRHGFTQLYQGTE